MLILSDVQCYDAQGIINSGTLDIIEALIQKGTPDLVLFLGDNSWSCNSKDKLRDYLIGWTKDIIELDIGEWYHVVYIYTGNSTAVYINGELASSHTGITEPYRNPNFGNEAPYICIGGCAQVNKAANPKSGNRGMSGSIAIAKIFSNSITAEEAIALYDVAPKANQ